MSREVCQHTQHKDYRHRDAREQTIDTIREVSAIRHRGDDKDRHKDVEQPCEQVVATSDILIVECCILKEGDRGLGGLDGCGADDVARLYGVHDFASLRVDNLELLGLKLLLVDDDIAR